VNGIVHALLRRIVMSRFVASLAVGVCAALLVGCGDKATTPTGEKAPPPGEFKPKKDGHDHSDHDSGKVQFKDGEAPGGKKCHVGLTAHLSKKGDHELEVVFETFDKKPLPIPEKTKVTARVTRAGDDKAYDLEFKPGDKDERKTDPDGQCSRFAAETPWMKPDNKLTVTLTIEGVSQKLPWVDFDVKKYSHEGD
jgi:hypothetical protein